MDISFSETSLLQHLEALPAQLEIDVRYESLADEGDLLKKIGVKKTAYQ